MFVEVAETDSSGEFWVLQLLTPYGFGQHQHRFFFPGLILFPSFSSITYINFTVSLTHSFSTIVSTVSFRQFVGK